MNYRPSEETKRKISESNKGKHNRRGFTLSEEHKRKISNTNSKPSLETRLRRSLAAKRRVEAGTHNFWKGGVTSENKKIRQSYEYRLWREAVYKRDNYTCQDCKVRGGLELSPHHIKPFSLFPELRFAIDNGVTLCRDCHLKTDTFGFKLSNKKIYA